MSRYVIHVLASQDLNKIADYFAEHNGDVRVLEKGTIAWW